MSTQAAPVTVTGTGSTAFDDMTAESSTPGLAFKETDGATDQKWWRFYVDGNKLKWQLLSDALSAADVMVVTPGASHGGDAEVAFPQGKLCVNTGGAPPTGVEFQVGGPFRVRDSVHTLRRADINPNSGMVIINSYEDYPTDLYLPLTLDGISIQHKPSGGATGGFTTTSTGTAVNGAVTADNLGTWNSLSYGSGWADASGTEEAGGYRKVGDTVQLKGWMARSTASTTPFTLSAGFRPSANRNLFAIGYDGSAYVAVRVNISTGGVVVLSPSVTKVSMAGLEFDL